MLADERFERDSLGEVQLPADELWGARERRQRSSIQCWY
jgi:fumarate hydratase class II